MRGELSVALGTILVALTAVAIDGVIAPETAPIATVNGQEIAWDRFNALFAHAAAHLEDTPASAGRAIALKRTIARQLIDEKLLEDEARKRRITVPDRAVDRVIDALRRELRTEERWGSYLRQRSGGLVELRRATRLRLLTEALAGVDPSAPVPENEARAFYERYKTRFDAPESVIVHDVSFALAPDAPPEPARAIRARAVAAAQRMQREAPPVVAKQIAGIARVLRLTAKDGALWAAASRLRDGSVSDVIETGGALHVLKFARRVSARKQSFEQARQEIASVVRRQKQSAAIAQLLARLHASAKIENHLEARYAHRRSMTVDPSSVTPRLGVPQKVPRSKP